MKNRDIIRDAAIRANVVTEEEAAEMEAGGREIPFHTASGWEQKGYRVKDGETGTEVRLWKKKDNDKFYLARAYLYGSSQVEKDE